MDENDIEGGGIVIADELRVLFDEIRNDLSLMRADIALINYDVIQIREQLDRIESNRQQPQESMGIAPNTPGPDFIPPEYL